MVLLFNDLSTISGWLLCFCFNNVLVNKFSDMLGWSHRILGIYQYFGVLIKSCSMILHSDLGVEPGISRSRVRRSSSRPPHPNHFRTTKLIVKVSPSQLSPKIGLVAQMFINWLDDSGPNFTKKSNEDSMLLKLFSISCSVLAFH